MVIFATCAGGLVYLWYKKQITTPPSNTDQVVEIDIISGETAKEIAVKLEKEGVISNSDVFYIYLQLNDLTSRIQAGRFFIQKNLTMKEVAVLLQKAASTDIKVRIKEGQRLDQLAEQLELFFLNKETSNFEKNLFESIVNQPDDYGLDVELLDIKPAGKSLEGFLYPDTFFVDKDITTKQLIVFLINTLAEKLDEEGLDIHNDKQLTPYEILILASIIEREANKTDDRFMISNIFRKRLRGEMNGVKLLQADATLLYELKDWKAVVTVQLKEGDSPYNTYKFPGLPPTPICNPSIESINAALNPKVNDYLYYLHDDEGFIHYAKTLDEHNNNVRCFINKNTEYCL